MFLPWKVPIFPICQYGTKVSTSKRNRRNPFGTKGCTPCAALRLSLRTLRLAQFADANSTTHKSFEYVPMTVYRFSVGGLFISLHQNQGGHALWQNRKPSPNWKPRKQKMNAKSLSSNTKSSSLKTVSPTMKKENGASGAPPYHPWRSH